MADEAPPTPATGEPAPAPPPPPPPPAPSAKPDADLGEAGTKALKEERAARREAERQLKELAPLAAKAKELEDASKSEAEKLTERLNAAEQRAVAAETNALRLEIAGEKGLTPTQAKRLIGTTRKELEADADDLLATFAPPAPPAPKPGSRPKESLRTVVVASNGDTPKTDMNEWMREQAARKPT